MLKDTNNGMIEIWVVMAIEVVIISCTAFYYEAVCTLLDTPPDASPSVSSDRAYYL